MSDASALIELARRHTRGEASPRRHQASRARVLDRIAQRQTSARTFAVVAFVVGGTGALAFAGVKEYRARMSPEPQLVAVPTMSSVKVPAVKGFPPRWDPGNGVNIKVTPAYAKVYWDGKELPENPSSFHLQPDHKMHEVRAEAPGHAPKTQVVQLDTEYVFVEMRLAPLPVTLGPITASASVIDADLMSSALLVGFQSCYVSALEKAPTLAGKATVVLGLRDNGSVESVAITDQEGLNPELTTCLKTTGDDLHFRVTSKGFVKIPVVFRVK